MRCAPATSRVHRLAALCVALLGCRERPPAPAAAAPAPRVAAAQARADTARPPRPPADRPVAAYWDSVGPLVLPRVIEGCEGESCQEGYKGTLVACASLELLAADAAGAPVVGRVKAGDSVRVGAFRLHVMEPGVVVLMRPFTLSQEADAWTDSSRKLDPIRLAAGDTVFLLEYLELGNLTWWHRGHFRQSYWFWRDTTLSAGQAEPWMPGRLVRTVRRDQWVQLRTRSGAEGWWKEDDRDAPERRVVNMEQGGRCG